MSEQSSGPAVRIAHLYPELLNLYGDRGNVICLKQRCLWRGIGAEVEAAELVQEGSTPTATQQITAPDSKGSIAVLPGNNASEAVVRFSVPRDLKRAELTVFDLAGRVICRLPLTGLTEGMDYYQPLSLGALRGMAIVRISADGFSLSAKLLR